MNPNFTRMKASQGLRFEIYRRPETITSIMAQRAAAVWKRSKEAAGLTGTAVRMEKAARTPDTVTAKTHKMKNQNAYKSKTGISAM